MGRGLAPPAFLQELCQGAAPTRKPPCPPTLQGSLLTQHGQGQPGWCRAPEPWFRHKQTSAQPAPSAACSWPGGWLRAAPPRTSCNLLSLGPFLPSRGGVRIQSPERCSRAGRELPEYGGECLGNKIHDGGVNCQQALLSCNY